ncbi:MAG: hypothetical protein CMH15_12735 [Mesonia sp.]|uniref:Uncharacterized protein n=1 Tax=Mesonia oceanica TaxID=2687242 RepID=A0AC61Y537_9FLAO|nr:hypothetical protein [Mesonia sp.]MAQ41888.1 hypothetical protein [Mesonia sp.]MBJ98989.1 hypothetical protein [Flavobacteriaceae bacterium]VVU99187.1 hypothetical protein FVB9532_00439 [Mesonia oceanica]|tara:strand:+ start:20747 stop:21226 length:480 start_codon:yes stop_codon:yes gene_type:complete
MFPLIFTLVIGLININKFKFNFLKSLLLCVFFSYLSFFVGYFGSFFLGKLLGGFGDLGNISAIIISAFIISPILLYYSYSYIFELFKTKFNIYVMTITLTLMFIISFYTFYIMDYISDNNFFDTKLLNPFLLWQVIMALALQLILHQKELKALFKTKNR